MKELSRLLDAGLEDLSAKLYRMAEIAERTVETSIRGFLEGLDCTEKVKASSDILVKMSVDIEDKVFELISKYQPVASDLRIIKSYMKIGYDLERYGRYAWDISFIHKRLAKNFRYAIVVRDGEQIRVSKNFVLQDMDIVEIRAY